ncbi:MAG TPA: hypothetical protein V6D12_14050 [Candidatus Obscuribacterales bacterium]
MTREEMVEELADKIVAHKKKLGITDGGLMTHEIAEIVIDAGYVKDPRLAVLWPEKKELPNKPILMHTEEYFLGYNLAIDACKKAVEEAEMVRVLSKEAFKMTEFEIACAGFVEDCISDDKTWGKQPDSLWKKRFMDFRIRLIEIGII